MRFDYWLLEVLRALRILEANPANPVPSSSMAVGSGTGSPGLEKFAVKAKSYDVKLAHGSVVNKPKLLLLLK